MVPILFRLNIRLLFCSGIHVSWMDPSPLWSYYFGRLVVEAIEIGFGGLGSFGIFGVVFFASALVCVFPACWGLYSGFSIGLGLGVGSLSFPWKGLFPVIWKDFCS